MPATNFETIINFYYLHSNTANAFTYRYIFNFNLIERDRRVNNKCKKKWKKELSFNSLIKKATKIIITNCCISRKRATPQFKINILYLLSYRAHRYYTYLALYFYYYYYFFFKCSNFSIDLTLWLEMWCVCVHKAKHGSDFI